MKPEGQYLPSRQAVIYSHTRQMLDHTALCVRKFSTRVAEQYMALVEPEARQVPFRWGVTVDDLFRAERHNGQIISRYLDGTVKVLPADLEDAWVTSLEEPHRSACERDLARRRGLLPVRMPVATEAGQMVSIGHLMVQVGELIEALGPALADGLLSEADLPHARRILDESDDVIKEVLEIRSQITKLLPGHGKRVRNAG